MTLHTFTVATIIAAAFVVGGSPTSAQSVAGIPAIENVRRELLQLPYYDVFDFLSFSYDKGTVTLTGYARQPTLKNDAEQAIKRVSGVDTVVDNVEVLPASSIDDALRWKLYYVLFNDPFISHYTPGGELLWGHRHAFPSDRFFPLGPGRFPGTEPAGNYPIHIIVNQGRITLLGVVDSESDKAKAGLLAQGVPGSSGVENELTVDSYS